MHNKSKIILLIASFIPVVLLVALVYSIFPWAKHGYTDDISHEIKEFGIQEQLLAPLVHSRLFYIKKYNSLSLNKFFYFYGTVEREKLREMIDNHLYDVVLNDGPITVSMREDVPDDVLHMMQAERTGKYSADMMGTRENPSAFLTYISKTYVIRIRLSLETGGIVGEVSKLLPRFMPPQIKKSKNGVT